MSCCFLKRLLPFAALICLGAFPIIVNSQSKPLVVATASIFADMANAIGGDLIEVQSIVPIGGDPHIYEPTPGDVRLLLKADLILKNGLTFEGWLESLIANSGSKAPAITLTEGINPITSSQYQNATDPHAWMDPVNGKVYVQNIRKAFAAMLPEHTAAIDSAAESYLARLDALDAYIREQIRRIDSTKRILITSHDAFHYFGRRYGIQLEAILGTSTDADVRPSDIVRVQEVIRQNKVPAVFLESTINPKLLQQIATDNRIRIGGKLYSDSLGEEGSPAGTYIGMIRHNTDVIVDGLTQSSPNSGMEESGTRSNLIWLLVGILVVLGTGAFLLSTRKKSTR